MSNSPITVFGHWTEDCEYEAVSVLSLLLGRFNCNSFYADLLMVYVIGKPCFFELYIVKLVFEPNLSITFFIIIILAKDLNYCVIAL